MMDLLVDLQRWIYASIGSELTGFAKSRDWLTLASVLPLGIVFGAIHAFTPGHGKSVLVTYLVGSRLAVLRGMAVALTLAFTHVASAVIIALAAAPLVTRTLGNVGRAPLLEDISRGLLALIGAWLLWRALRGRHAHAPREGDMVGIVAGLVPCPLTLFVMFYALSRGVPEAGLTFALAMMLGVAATLVAFAVLAILARNGLMLFLQRHGARLDLLTRLLDGAAGLLLIAIGLRELMR
jgi:nickel/cobalt transporter (NicO) family protein